VTEKATNPGSEDEEHDQNEQRSTDGVHDGLEMTLVLGTLYERCGATDERVLSRSQSDTICFSALAASRVVRDFTHVLVDGERLSGDGRLIASDKRVTLDDWVFFVVIHVIFLVVIWLRIVGEAFLFLELVVQGKAFLNVIVVAD
jgi:hypothetical protein